MSLRGWPVEANFGGFMAECRLHRLWADADTQKLFDRLEKRLASFGNAEPSTEWEVDMRAVHDRLERAWKNAILASYSDLHEGGAYAS